MTQPNDDGAMAKAAYCRTIGCPGLNKGDLTCGWRLVDGKVVKLDAEQPCPLPADLAKVLKVVKK